MTEPGAGRDRQCLLHIGLHKTGSTSIQHLLSQGLDHLPARGWLYPFAGRIAERSGHHNLAWELTHDRRRRLAFGSISDLWPEIADRKEGVILSSEDFEGVVGHPQEFAAFVSELRRAGLTTTVVMYVRDQVEALSRNYLTMVMLGLNQPFGDFLEATLEARRYAWREWIVNFDYADLARWLQDHGVKVHVRSYEAARGEVCKDFLSVIGLRVPDLGLEREPRSNAALSLATYMTAYLRNRLGREAYEASAAGISPPGLAAGTIEVSPEARHAIRARFADSNRRLFEEYGVALPSVEKDGPGIQAPTAYLDQLFGAIA